MKFTIKKDEFNKALKRVQGVAGKGSTMPILQNILIVAKADSIQVTATDLEMSIRSKYKADVTEDGSVVVSAKKLYEIVRELPDETVKVSVNESFQTSITSGKSKFKLVGLGAVDYPNIPDVPETDMLGIGTELLSELVGKTLFAAAEGDSRAVLNGLFFEFIPMGEKGTAIKVVGTDGHRLAMIGRLVPGKKAQVSAIVPKRTLTEIKRLLDEESAESEMMVGLTNNHVVFRKNGTVALSKLVDGTYPNYSQVIPKDNDSFVKVSRQELLGVIRRMSVMASEKSKLLRFDVKSGSMSVSSKNDGTGDSTEEMKISYEGPEISVGFNGDYLMDAIGAMNNDQVTLALKGGTHPCLITSDEDVNSKNVVMPMRLS